MTHAFPDRTVHVGCPHCSASAARERAALEQVARLERILVEWADQDQRRADGRISTRDLVLAAGRGDAEAAKKLEV